LQSEPVSYYIHCPLSALIEPHYSRFIRLF
jgi:hypothetical protein